MMDLIESAQTVDLTEGIMDVVKQTFNDNVAGWPMGTSNEQFIQGWARDIKARTGKTVPTTMLAKLYNDYVSRKDQQNLMTTHGTTNEMDKSQPGQQRHGDYPLGAKGTNVKPVTPKKVVKDLTKALDQAFDKEKPVKEESQEYTVRVVDEENSGYTVKVQAASEQQALHKAIVKVRNQYDAYPEHARIIRQNVDEEQLEETTDEAVAKVEQLFRDK